MPRRTSPRKVQQVAGQRTLRSFFAAKTPKSEDEKNKAIQTAEKSNALKDKRSRSKSPSSPKSSSSSSREEEKVLILEGKELLTTEKEEKLEFPEKKKEIMEVTEDEITSSASSSLSKQATQRKKRTARNNKNGSRPRKRRVILEDSEEDSISEESESDEFIPDEGDDEPEDLDEDSEAEEEFEELTPPPKKVQKKNVSISPKNKSPSSSWGCLASFQEKSKTPKSQARKKPNPTKNTGSKASSASKEWARAYTDGENFSVISHPQDMFDDMISKQFKENSGNSKKLTSFLKIMKGRPLRVATMCSGTESPILALDMISKSLQSYYYSNLKDGGDNGSKGKGNDSTLLEVEHVFSCEIEPFKQAYIERNFQPPLLFRDIRELGNTHASTAYGAMAEVPHQQGCVDILIAGTSCVDYSNLNNEKKTIDQKGESGQTFRGMVEWIKKAQPPLVIIENVCGAPWDRKVKMFEGIGYDAAWLRVDTKQYYIPQTRTRGYLFAINRSSSKKQGSDSKSLVNDWVNMIKSMKRPASAALDAFMLSNDDPRVLRGRAQLSAASAASNGKDDNNRVDWTRCEARHLFARSDESLGDKRPFTGWSESGNTTLPDFAWNEWANAQVHRIHDLMDISLLRLAQCRTDPTYKTMVWNLSQNVDRDTMGKLGLCQCLTPTGVFYVTNRGGPLVGEELLSLQGIPVDDLLLTKETDDQLKDLAGNAMSTTVVGASILSALLLGSKSIAGNIQKNSKKLVVENCRSLVPRALSKQSDDIIITDQMGEYESKVLQLTSLSDGKINISQLLEEADSSARKCVSEGLDKINELTDLLKCSECGHTSCVANVTPPRKFEEHVFVPHPITSTGKRMEPTEFRKKIIECLPMRINLSGISTDDLKMPDGISKSLWSQWCNALNSSIFSNFDEKGNKKAAEFRFTRIERSHFWIVHYTGTSGARIELRISKRYFSWFLFANALTGTDEIENILKNPIARLIIDEDNHSSSIIDGVWEVCLPSIKTLEVIIEGVSDRVESWEARIGLKGGFENTRRFDKLNITVEGDPASAELVNGTYQLLPKCGGACGTLHKRVCEDGSVCHDMFFFLESGRCSLAENDSFVFSPFKHRTGYDEYREVYLSLEAGFRPSAPSDSELTKTNHTQRVKGFSPGYWQKINGANISFVEDSSKVSSSDTASIKYPLCNLQVLAKSEGWKMCPLVISCTVPLLKSDMLYQVYQIEANSSTFSATGQILPWVEVNLQKSRQIFNSLAFVSSRLNIPLSASKSWLEIEMKKFKLDEKSICATCAPPKPSVKWMVVTKGNRQKYIPKEDGKEAASFEYALKHRPHPWKVLMKAVEPENNLSANISMKLDIGFNAFSLANRALALFPKSTLARKAMLQQQSNQSDMICEWRIVPHLDKSISTTVDFEKLTLTSNKKDKNAFQPPNFKRHPLRKEQLRSLKWMLSQEATDDQFYEEEVCEAILPNLNWRGEARVKRPIMVRGGIVADEVGYGKTAITLGLIDAAVTVNGPPPLPPNDIDEGSLRTDATLVVIPAHLMGQWPNEIKKFVGNSKRVCIITDMNSFNRLTVQEVQEADIVLVNFKVLCSDKYFERLARLAGVNPKSLPNTGKTGANHFRALYNDCITGLANRVRMNLKGDLSSTFEEIEKDSRKHELNQNEASSILNIDGKKTIYKQSKEVSNTKSQSKKAPSKARSKVSGTEHDPWGLSSGIAKKNVKKMKCPPLELFFWNRLVIDEFHYLAEKADRARVLTLVLGLQSTYRWCLSGTPPHKSFDDVKTLANLLGLHLGVDESLPGIKPRRGTASVNDDTSQLEKFSSLLEVRSIQWHERRHVVAQAFLDRFVRQNIAEIDEIKSEEHIEEIVLPPAERAIYLELETHLKSLEMNSKKAMKSKKRSSGDREQRMQRVLEDSSNAEEALLKRSTHFEISVSGGIDPRGDGKMGKRTALQMCEEIYSYREKEKLDCENDLTNNLISALRQRLRILKLQPNWEGSAQSEKGEVQDRLALYEKDVKENQSVPGGADDEVNRNLLKILQNAQEQVRKTPRKYDPRYAEVNKDSIDEWEDDDANEMSKKRKRSKKSKVVSLSEDDLKQTLYDMKFSLREHMHEIRALGKELCGRIRALRYFRWVRDFQLNGEQVYCPREGSSICACTSTKKKLASGNAGVLSSCGHVGCLKCLNYHADREECVEPSCQAPVRPTNVVSAKDLGVDSKDHSQAGKFGAKLTAVVTKVKSLVNSGDRVIVFVQFDDLKRTVKEALELSGVSALQVKGTVQQQTRSLSILQKEVPEKKDPRVLLLTMDDESSAGVNLTTCNHAIFVHPLLAETQQQYDAYETQAIGRIRRYGQTKTVHIWRFLASNTIDTEIYNERAKHFQNKVQSLS